MAHVPLLLLPGTHQPKVLFFSTWRLLFDNPPVYFISSTDMKEKCIPTTYYANDAGGMIYKKRKKRIILLCVGNGAIPYCDRYTLRDTHLVERAEEEEKKQPFHQKKKKKNSNDYIPINPILLLPVSNIRNVLEGGQPRIISFFFQDQTAGKTGRPFIPHE